MTSFNIKSPILASFHGRQFITKGKIYQVCHVKQISSSLDESEDVKDHRGFTNVNVSK